MLADPDDPLGRIGREHLLDEASRKLVDMGSPRDELETPCPPLGGTPPVKIIVCPPEPDPVLPEECYDCLAWIMGEEQAAWSRVPPMPRFPARRLPHRLRRVRDPPAPAAFVPRVREHPPICIRPDARLPLVPRVITWHTDPFTDPCTAEPSSRSHR